MRPIRMLVTGTGLGAGLMYVLDPRAGARRRALARDQAVHAIRLLGDRLDVARRDGANRLRGVAAELRGMLAPEPLPDPVLTERIRARLGLATSHPGAIEIAVTDR